MPKLTKKEVANNHNHNNNKSKQRAGRVNDMKLLQKRRLRADEISASNLGLVDIRRKKEHFLEGEEEELDDPSSQGPVNKYSEFALGDRAGHSRLAQSLIEEQRLRKRPPVEGYESTADDTEENRDRERIRLLEERLAVIERQNNILKSIKEKKLSQMNHKGSLVHDLERRRVAAGGGGGGGVGRRPIQGAMKNNNDEYSVASSKAYSDVESAKSMKKRDKKSPYIGTAHIICIYYPLLILYV
jgi:hypothetical protein